MIKTERLSLVGYNLKYTNELFELWNDFETIKYTFTPLMNSIDDVLSIFNYRSIALIKILLIVL